MTDFSEKRAHFSKIAVIGNYLPRKCGIATFTTDTCNALTSFLDKNGEVGAVVMNDLAEGYNYPDIVKYEIRENIQKDYYVAADFLNTNQYEAVVLQHEYGIFGKEAGYCSTI